VRTQKTRLVEGDDGASASERGCSSDLMTEAELIRFLRIPEVSNSKNHHYVVENLKRVHDLPRIHICGKPLYPREAIRKWIEKKRQPGNNSLALLMWMAIIGPD
jgi:hypothetical protein